ncbi:EH domain-containing protein 2 [Capsicum baccatum]|uniref:EH domain-containing protein 2 n=1 Tax=Capsicum baccatum TaxID=33114 RepID=A0A2G2X2P1_CAPBA|nr:EH domain-containing protein 2 [Capsicum baccatum]
MLMCLSEMTNRSGSYSMIDFIFWKNKIQPCLTAVTAVSDGLKGLYNEKLKPLEQTYRFNDFASPTLTENDGHAFGLILDRKNQFYQIHAKVQLSRKKALFNGTPDFSMPYNVITIT